MSEKEESLARVDRETAAWINPAICDIGVSGTCEQVASAMGVLSMYVVTAEALNEDAFCLLQRMLAAALNYEAAQQRTKPEEKDPPVKRVK